MLTGKSKASEFKEYFAAIPDELWTTDQYTHPSNPACHCALGHISTDPGLNAGDVGKRLHNLFREAGLYTLQLNCIPKINDGLHPTFQQREPKARIIAALDACIEKGL